ncbi:MAG TPA: alpha/beta hydrolase-fold protein [Kofleriaceae bacterium]|nr:alpha/beta hydrolase-fold protein [Kofleriaceae bacterium]
MRHIRPLLVLAVSLAAGCAAGSPGLDPTPDGPHHDPGDGHAGTDAGPGDAPPATDGAPTDPDGDVKVACSPEPDGLGCLFALYDRVIDGCDAGEVADLREAVSARHGRFPAWDGGRAMFVSLGAATDVAGDFNDWMPGMITTAAVCGTDLYVATADIPSGYYEYKLYHDGTWRLDPEAWAFAYDDFSANPDHKNSVLNTYDSGRGHLVRPDELLCSDALNNCRPLTTYLPPGYGAPNNAGRHYPVIFMHDGQNIFDDKQCCFGHTGWEVNVTLDREIAAGHIGEVIIVGFDHAGDQRIAEYGTATADGGLRETFMAFQVEVVQSRAAQLWRLDAERVYTAGSSLGGAVAFELAFRYPDVYAGAASLSGAFGFAKDSGHAFFDTLSEVGYVPALALYLDHGGTVEGGEDGIADSIAVRDQLADAGWTRSDSPACTSGAGTLCYFHDVGATHDELAWGARANRFLQFLVPGDQ